MEDVDQVCARAVLLSPGDTVLLMEVVGGGGALWVTPGGRLEPGETVWAALVRELHEELGVIGLERAPEVWVRHGEIGGEGVQVTEREHFFLVRTAVFEPQPADMDAAESQRFVRFRWWSPEEIHASEARFSPARLGDLLAALVRDGPPPEPIDSGP